MTYKVVGGKRSPEFSRGVKVGSGLVILNLAISSCVLEARPTPTPPTSTSPRATETFIPSPSPTESLVGSAWDHDDILSFGRSLGLGGTGEAPTLLYADDSLVKKLYERDGLRAIVDGARLDTQGRPLLTQTQTFASGIRFCLPNSTDELFNPEVAEQGDFLLRIANFTKFYGDRNTNEVRFQTIPAISLAGVPDSVVCINTIARADRANFFGVRPGTVMTVLVDPNAGEIIGGYPSVFASDVNLSFDQVTGRLTADGQIVWFEGPGMASVLVTPSPTERPQPTPTEMPRSFADPELINQILETFYARTGYSTLEEALKSLETNPDFKWFVLPGGLNEEMNYWAVGGWFLAIGRARLSISQVPGAAQGDYVQLMYVAHPRYGAETLFPLIVGVRWKGSWTLAPSDFYLDLYNVESSGPRKGCIVEGGLDSPEEVDLWLDSQIGKIVIAGAYARFENDGDWKGVHFDNSHYYCSNDAPNIVKELMDALVDGYFQRTTKDHWLLGTQKYRTNQGPLPGEAVELSTLYDLLKPGYDPGLFTTRLWPAQKP